MTFENLKTTMPWHWPEDADKIVLNVLQDRTSTPRDKERAAEMAGSPVIVNIVLIEALLKIIKTTTETELLRTSCTMALGPILELLDIGDLDDHPDLHACALKIPKTLHLLFLNPHEPADLRRRALETSVRLEQDWHRDIIRTAFSTQKTEWQRTAVFAMRFVAGFEKQIIEALNSLDEETEFLAVCAADEWQIEAAWEHILELAQNTETEKVLRMVAVEALVAIRPHAAAEFIEELDVSADEDLIDVVQEVLTVLAGD